VYAESTATMITHDDHADNVMVCASHAPTRGPYLPCTFYCSPIPWTRVGPKARWTTAKWTMPR